MQVLQISGKITSQKLRKLGYKVFQQLEEDCIKDVSTFKEWWTFLIL